MTDDALAIALGPVDLTTAELEISGSIYEGFAAAIMVKGKPRTVALTREYSDAVQLMALVESNRNGRPTSQQALSRDDLIAIIMEETTDEIVADGWRSLGAPNALVQGCRYIRCSSPPNPEGYENPDEAARNFAGFIADRVLAAFSQAAASEGGS